MNSQGIADSGEPEDRKRLAAALRGVAYSTSAANIRNWCITRALELDESLNLSRFRKHRFNKRELARRTPIDSLKLLRVLLIPENADAYEQTLQFNFSDDENIFYSIRNSIAVIDKNSKSSLSLSLSSDTWYDLLSMKKTLSEVEEEALVKTNNFDEIRKFFSCFDLESLNS